MQKISIFIYGILAYIVGLVGQIWLILYISDWGILSSDINTSQSVSYLNVIVIDTALVLLFGLQHSLMARDWFKQWLIHFIPHAAERSTYVLLSGVAFILLCLYWEPIDGYLWYTEDGLAYYLLSIGFVFGWVFSVVATFIINHFELFGLQQIYLNLLSKPTPTISFQEKFFYKFVRHPIQLGVLLGLWLTPTMSYGHLLLAILFSIYIFIGLYYEEKDLVAELGEVYVDYKKRVGHMIPRRRK